MTLRVHFSETVRHNEKQLEQTLPSILHFILNIISKQPPNKQIETFINHFLLAILRSMFDTMDYGSIDKLHEQAFQYMKVFLATLEGLVMDFNGIVDGKIGLFYILSTNVPDDLIPRLIEILPKSFKVAVTIWTIGSRHKIDVQVIGCVADQPQE